MHMPFHNVTHTTIMHVSQAEKMLSPPVQMQCSIFALYTLTYLGTGQTTQMSPDCNTNPGKRTKRALDLDVEAVRNVMMFVLLCC